jgi:transcriptional regulator with XRE-family HTH domain
MGLTQAAFAQKLGVNQTAVSQYERDIIRPSTQVLFNLCFVAESQGASNDCRERFLKELAEALHVALLGPSGTRPLEDLLDSLRPMAGRLTLGTAVFRLLPKQKKQDSGMRYFADAVAVVIENCGTVDLAVLGILRLWAAHWNSPEALQYFQDALGFLRTNLWKMAHSAEAAPEDGEDES